MKLDWITDPHLDHLRDEQALIRFLRRLHERDSDALLLTGDVAESDTLYDFLGLLSGAYQRPIYFVLGNHDYYGAWRETTHQRVRAVCQACPPGILNWMPDAGAQMLGRHTAVVGHDGIYDARAGDPGVDFGMADFATRHGIRDLVMALEHGSRHLFDLLEKLAQESARHVAGATRAAVREGARRVVVLTHVPPFHEASHFRGRISDARSAPWYVNVTLGETLRELADELPDVRLEVLAGHTHGACVHEATPNMTVRVGGARYGRPPKFQEPLTV